MIFKNKNNIVGNGEKFTFRSRLIVTGTEDIPASLNDFNKINFPDLIFTTEFDSLITFNETTGIFTMLKSGPLLNIYATLNLISTGTSQVDITPYLDTGSGFNTLAGRCKEIPVVGNNQLVFVGSIPNIRIGDKIKFAIEAANTLADFATSTLGSGATLPAAIIDFNAFIK